jgi:hypothetical protein
MLATGQIKPDQDQETEGKKKVTGPKSRVQSPPLDTQPPAATRGRGPSVPSSPSGAYRGTDDKRRKAQDSPDPTYEERVQALLRYVDKPPMASGARPDAFQGMPLAQADPARVVDFTRKKGDSEERSPENPGDSPKPSSRRGGGPSRPSEGEEQAPTIRPVQWSQIKKKE